MKVLIIRKEECDFTEVLSACGAEIDQISLEEAARSDISSYDAYCVLGSGKILEARLNYKLKEAAAAGKRVFIEAAVSFYDIPTAEADTTRSRLIYLENEGYEIPGLTTGDLLDDECNTRVSPVFGFRASSTPILVYKHHIIAHSHLNASADEILKDSFCGLWMDGDNVMITSFRLHNFIRARFAPREAWEKLVRFIARWITGSEPSRMPEPAVQYGTVEDLTDDAAFEACRKETIVRGMDWLRSFVVDNGEGGIREGLSHKITPEGVQIPMNNVRNDCSGEASGAFRMYARAFGDDSAEKIAKGLDSFTYGNMLIREGMFKGFMRWSDESWDVCYQDDIARCVISGLYNCLFMGDDSAYSDICLALDAMVNVTAKDGCRRSRFDFPRMTAGTFEEVRNEEHSSLSCHHNSYTQAAFLLAYKYGKNPVYLDIGKRGLETLMEAYPNTVLEHSETQEICRMILPMAILYDVTREEKHKEMLYRLVNDLEKFRHPSGGYFEWDTEYKAHYSRVSTSECSLLTENGDPVADLLYSINWLPCGFAYAYYATGDEWFRELWKNIVRFCMKTQVISKNPIVNGAWCRAFDMDLWESYGCPHDEGWAAYACETGWTNAEILMGMMMPDILGTTGK